MKEWCSGAHSVFENGSERVSELIFSLMSESWAKLKKLMSVEHVVQIRFPGENDIYVWFISYSKCSKSGSNIDIVVELWKFVYLYAWANWIKTN